MFVQSVCRCNICYVHVTMYEQMFWQVEVIHWFSHSPWHAHKAVQCGLTLQQPHPPRHPFLQPHLSSSWHDLVISASVVHTGLHCQLSSPNVVDLEQEDLRWALVPRCGQPISKQLLSGFVNSQATIPSIIQQNDILHKDLLPVILYRSWGAVQGDENRYNLREAVPSFECCLLGLSKEAEHSVTSTERMEGCQSKCIVLTKGTGNLMSWKRSTDWYQCQMLPIVGCSLVFALAASAPERHPVREHQCQRNGQRFWHNLTWLHLPHGESSCVHGAS